MTVRPSLARSIPFWILLAGSLASAAAGTVLVIDKVTTMTDTLTDGSATGVEVYAGQSWIMLGSALVGAGLIGLVAVLSLAAARSFFAVAEEPVLIEEVESVDVFPVAPVVDAAPAGPAAPAAETPAEPVAPAAETPAESDTATPDTAEVTETTREGETPAR